MYFIMFLVSQPSYQILISVRQNGESGGNEKDYKEVTKVTLLNKPVMVQSGAVQIQIIGA